MRKLALLICIGILFISCAAINKEPLNLAKPGTEKSEMAIVDWNLSRVPEYSWQIHISSIDGKDTSKTDMVYLTAGRHEITYLCFSNRHTKGGSSYSFRTIGEGEYAFDFEPMVKHYIGGVGNPCRPAIRKKELF